MYSINSIYLIIIVRNVIWLTCSCPLNFESVVEQKGEAKDEKCIVGKIRRFFYGFIVLGGIYEPYLQSHLE